MVLSTVQETNTAAEDVTVSADTLDSGDCDDDAMAEGVCDLGPSARLLITGCWLTMKETSLLMGAIGRHIPLEGEVTAPMCTDHCGIVSNLNSTAALES